MTRSDKEIARGCGCRYQTSYEHDPRAAYPHVYVAVPRICRTHAPVLRWLKGSGVDSTEYLAYFLGELPDLKALHATGSHAE